MDQANKKRIETGAWSAIGGAAIAMIIGFAWGGWVLGSNSRNMGEEMAQTAIIERLAPICVAQYNQDLLKVEKFKTMNEKNSWDRGDFVKAQGWATMPFEKDADNSVAERCSELIMEKI
ncbi:hypothetical protein ACFLZL_05095 [Thermodesulfobacteriota bacterium]